MPRCERVTRRPRAAEADGGAARCEHPPPALRSPGAGTPGGAGPCALARSVPGPTVFFSRMPRSWPTNASYTDVVHEQPLDAQAHLAAVEEAARVGHSCAAASTSASSHTIIGSLPPSSSVTRLICAPGDLHHVAADFGRAGEGDAPHARVAQQLFADLAAGAGDDVDRARRQLASCRRANVACWISSAVRSVASGVVDAGLMTIVLPAASAGPSLVPISVSGKFHGMMRAAHADRLADHQAVGALLGQRHVAAADLGRQARVELQAVHQVVDLEIGLEERLALLGGQQLGDLGGVLVDQLARVGQRNAAVFGGSFGPGAERLLARRRPPAGRPAACRAGPHRRRRP